MDYHIIKEKSCCFFGHREIIDSVIIKDKLYSVIEKLITENGVDTFLFGSKSQFNSLSYSVVSELKNKYKFIKRIYVRAEYPYIDDSYMNYLFKFYEYTYYPSTALKAGKAVYIKRNYDMINNSKYSVIYYDKNYSNKKSGTEIAYNYALKNRATVYNLYF